MSNGKICCYQFFLFQEPVPSLTTTYSYWTSIQTKQEKHDKKNFKEFCWPLLLEIFDKPVQTKQKSLKTPLEAENNGKRQEKPATTLSPGKKLVACQALFLTSVVPTLVYNKVWLSRLLPFQSYLQRTTTWVLKVWWPTYGAVSLVIWTNKAQNYYISLKGKETFSLCSLQTQIYKADHVMLQYVLVCL